MAENSNSPPADEAAPAAVDTVPGSAEIYDAETRPNPTTIAELARRQSDEIVAQPPPTMTPSQRLAVLVAQTRLRNAQSAAEPAKERAIERSSEGPKSSLAPVGSTVSYGGRASPEAGTTPGEPAVPQSVEGERTEKDESPAEQVVASRARDALPPELEEPPEPVMERGPGARRSTAVGSGRGLRIGLVAVLVGGLACLALVWIVPKLRATPAPQAPGSGAHAPSSSTTAVDLTPRQPTTPPAAAPSPAAPATAAPAAPAVRDPAERAPEPGEHAPPVRAEEEDLSPDRPSPTQTASARRKHDSARAQPGKVRSSDSRATHTRAKTKGAARPASTSKHDPDDILPLLTR